MQMILAASLLAITFTSVAVRADVVTEWNQIALRTIAATRILPLEQTRALALVHTAMFDAMNAIERKYRAYAYDGIAPAGASPDAAAAAAARAVLLKLYPQQQDAIEINYADAIASIAESAAKTAGINVGEQAAAAVLAKRANDGIDARDNYRPYTKPGTYVPTAQLIGVAWAKTKPWALKRADQFRPGPPPPLKSARWARDYNEIKQLGARTSAVRTPEQAEVAQFWIVTGPASWNPIVRDLAASGKRDALANARLFALASIAAMDVLVAVFDAKYAYNFWRPITAIRNADRDGNDATAADLGWLSLIEAPLHPEYPCAHCASAGAVAAVLESEFGKEQVPPFSLTSPTASGPPRTWTRVSDWAEEIDNARMWGGIHYRFSTEAGAQLGRKVGGHAVANFLQPKSK